MKVIFNFETELAAEKFVEWLCGSGEQSYWEWMEIRETEEEEDMTVQFDYWTNKKKFCSPNSEGDVEINTKLQENKNK